MDDCGALRCRAILNGFDVLHSAVLLDVDEVRMRFFYHLSSLSRDTVQQAFQQSPGLEEKKNKF